MQNYLSYQWFHRTLERSLLSRWNRYLLPPNYIVDRMIDSIPLETIDLLPSLSTFYLDLSVHRYEQWVRRYFPDWRERFGDLRHKKLIEFFITFTVLAPGPDDVLMDAAGGFDTYVDQVPCGKRLIQDIIISQELVMRFGATVEYLESDASAIPLPDGSVDKIACHHSFEHFQGDSDIRFVNEIQRLLAPGGKACIVPIFIANHYVEITNVLSFDRRFDLTSHYLVDPTAMIPGPDSMGMGYARVYDLRAFTGRIASQIDLTKYHLSIAEARLDGQAVPDLRLPCHKRVTAINRPYRALIIERYG